MGLLSIFKRKQPKVQKRNYSGARISNLFASWATSNTSADAEIHRDLSKLRARSRDLCRNNDYAKKFIRMVRTNVIGQNGIKLQMKVRDPDGTQDKLANQAIEEAWHKWGKKGTCDVTGRHSWTDIQKLAVGQMAQDGEVLIRMVRGYPNKYGFALQLIEADHLDLMHNDAARNIRMGIEYDEWGKPIAYHLLTRHPGDMIAVTATQKRERVPADEIIHLFIPDRASQSRGVPWLHTAISRLQMLGAYEEAEVVAARLGAAKAGFYLQPGGDDFSLADDYEGETPVQELSEPGVFEKLPPGWDFKPYDPQHPTTAFGEFVKSTLRGIASGLDVSYNYLANDLEGVNYSSIRAGVLDERDMWRGVQQFVIEHLCQPVFEAWLEMALLKQAITQNTKVGPVALPFAKYDKFNAATWHPRGWAWVDPQKDINAQIMAINAGLKTATQVAAETGQDIEEIYAQLAAEKVMREQYGIELGDESVSDKVAAVKEAKELVRSDEFAKEVEKQLVDMFVGSGGEKIKQEIEQIDIKTPREIYQYHIENGVVTINEVRENIGLDPVPDGDKPAIDCS